MVNRERNVDRAKLDTEKTGASAARAVGWSESKSEAWSKAVTGATGQYLSAVLASVYELSERNEIDEEDI